MKRSAEMPTLAFLALLLGFGFWIILPLTRREDFRAAEYAVVGELKDLYALRDVAYDTLRDLEFDYSMGKMAEKDYRELKTRYQGEAAEILTTSDAGIVVRPGEIQGLAKSLTLLVNDRNLRERLGRNGRHVSVTRFNRAVIAEGFMHRLGST